MRTSENQLFGPGIADAIIYTAFGLSQCWGTSDYMKGRRDGILDQEVDKFSLLLANTFDKAEELQETNCQFPKVPLQTYPGRHGPGLALRTKDPKKLAYFCDLIETFQGVMPKEYHLFSIKQGNGPWRHFEPLVKPMNWDTWRGATSPGSHREQPPPAVSDLVDGIASAVRGFSPHQVIAFGRHITPQLTAKSIRWLFDRVREEFDSYLNDFGCRVGIWSSHLANLYENAREAQKKAVRDRPEYKYARSVLLAKPTNLATKAILEVRRAAEDIWDVEEVSKLIPICERTYCFTRILRATAHIWASENGHALSGRPIDSDPQLELDDALRTWEEVMGETFSSVLVGELRQGRVFENKQALVALFGRLGLPNRRS
jgi:hypothetical protein